MKIAFDKKLLGGFVLCSLILLVVAVISFRNSEKFLDTNQLVNHTHEVLYELEQIMVSAVEAESGARGFVITGNEEYLAPFLSSKNGLADHLERARSLTRDNPTQIKNFELLMPLTVDHLAHLDQCIELRNEDFDKARVLMSSGESRRILNQIRSLIGEARRVEQELMVTRKQHSENDARDFNIIFTTLLVIIVIVLVTVYIIIMTNLKALRKAEQETADRNRTLAGSGELVKAMQGNKGLAELGQIILSRLTSYLDVPMAAIYITEKDSASLRLTASYALTLKEQRASTIRFGENLAGQAAAEKKSVLLHDVGPQHFTVGTGFGEMRPSNILAFPFLFEDNVVGVVELGGTQRFTEQQKQYLQFVSDSIAIGMISARAREEVKDLLEETQRQAEELEAQQDELRQANDELYAKTELLERSEVELRARQEELQEANVELEEKANLLEEQKEKLEDAKAEIEQKAHEVGLSSRYKSEFLANMSHELRTPLNSILILAQLLSENKNNRLGEKEVEFARNIYTSGTGLLNLINEILDLSKIEAGKMELDIEKVSIPDMMHPINAMFSEIAASKLVSFRVHVEESVSHATVTTDKQRVEQILRNLLSNAFKFTHAGGTVTLTVGVPPRTAFPENKNLQSATMIAFAVTDTGIGIPDDKQAIIFQAFQQADGSTKRKYGGTGLGLSISRELANALGGEILLRSEEGKGSTFTLYLPIEFDNAFIVSADKQIGVKERGHRMQQHIQVSEEVYVKDDRQEIGDKDKVILILEDDEKFGQVLLDFIRERGYKGVIASQGNTGISLARHYKPVAMLLDMNLPVMDGHEVLKQVKNDPELRHIPVQVISAYDRKREGMLLGAFDYIRKPVSVETLRQVFERIEIFTSKKLKKLLIVEDNELQNKAIRELIGNGDVQCFSAYDGKTAYENLETDSFDCIIVDLGLPDMTGFELMEKIRNNDRLNKIPIVVYTGKDLKREDNARLSKLADTVVLKTANSQERLLDETILFLHRVESALPKDKQKIIRKLHKTDEILRNRRILLVDDDIRNIYSLTNALEEEGMQCITAENGRIALETLKKDPSIELVLMDIMMPEMDGYEATLEIRKLDEFKKLPIIALTAKAMKGDKEKCLAVGMSDYVSKPVDVAQLLSLMRVWLYK